MLPLLVSLLAFSPLVLSLETFVGCFSQLQGTQFAVPTSGRGIAGCAAACYTESQASPRYRGQITNAGYQVSTGVCRCTAGALAGINSLPTTQTSPPECTDTTAYTILRVGTTFTFDKCYSGAVTGSTAFQASTLNQCFDTCKGARGLLISHQPINGYLVCACTTGDPYRGGPEVACDSGSEQFYRYDHAAPAASGGLNRRQKVRALRKDDYCPGNSTACMSLGRAFKSGAF